MDIGIVSVRYAKALMAYSSEAAAEERVYAEMQQLEQSFSRHPELVAALDNPIRSREEKHKLICLAAAGNAPVSAEFGRFIDLVLKNGREGILRYIGLSFADLYRKRHHIAVARLTTAVPVKAEVVERIKERAAAMLHASMDVRAEVNPAIEGGFVFDVNGYRLDASVATQLERVKQQFIEQNRRVV